MSKKKKPSDMGMNKTGMGTAPVQGRMSAQGAQKTPKTSGTDFRSSLASTHLAYVRDAEPIGTAPPPSTLKGAANTAIAAIQGKKASVLLDKVGERLAFERTGTRLYDLLLVKHELQGSWDGGPTAELLQRFRDEELAHFHLLVDAMKQLGGDPTAMTPSADITAQEAMGIHHVIADARTTLAQALHAIQIAELADRDGWEMLIEVAEGFGKTGLAKQFRQAAAQEEIHLQHVRNWTRAHALAEAGVQPTAK